MYQKVLNDPGFEKNYKFAFLRQLFFVAEEVLEKWYFAGAGDEGPFILFGA